MHESTHRRACALITGVGGQDGSYLAELLLAQGYRVIGTVRPGSRGRLDRIAHLAGQIDVFEIDLLDRDAMKAVIRDARPTEIYNVAARASSSHLHAEPVLTLEHNGISVVNLLELILELDPAIRFCQASSSEMFGDTTRCPQDESAPFCPRNAYGAAKLYAHWMVANFRSSHGLFACSAILFNHESPRRGLEYVTRRISRGVAMIKAGRQEKLELGDLDARRDWGFAGDYVRAMWRMLQVPVAADYVVATGRLHSVRELCDLAFARAGLDYREYVIENADRKRQTEAVQLLGDPARARERLGWKPSKSFRELVEMMVDADMEAVMVGGNPV
jgi:GDPmannose 4,6-dehydratase